MIINLIKIESTPRSFDFQFEPGWWLNEDGNNQIQGLDGPLKCHMTLVKAGIRYILDGKISGYAMFSCDRCLEFYRRLLDLEFRLFLSTPISDSDQVELELSEDDMSVVFVDGNEVDLGDIVRDQIYISLPMKSLCRDDCAGLCPVCGINLNHQSCKCRQGKGHPEFLKLKALILNREH